MSDPPWWSKEGGLDLPSWLLQYQLPNAAAGAKEEEAAELCSGCSKTCISPLWLRLHISFGLNSAITHTYAQSVIPWELDKKIAETKEFGPYPVTQREASSAAAPRGGRRVSLGGFRVTLAGCRSGFGQNRARLVHSASNDLSR